MPWRSSKSATPLQSTLTQNAPVNPLQSAVANSLDLKSLRMNTCKKGWGYPPVEAPVEAPVRPRKTNTSGFRSPAGVCEWLILPGRRACKRVSQVPVPILTCTEHILSGLPARYGIWVGAGRIYGERGWLSGGAISSADGQAHRMGPDRQLRESAYVVYVLRVDLPTSAA